MALVGDVRLGDEVHIVMETRDFATSHDRIADILTDGLTLRDSPALKAVKGEVFEDGTL